MSDLLDSWREISSSSSNNNEGIVVIAPKWPVSSSVPPESSVADDVGGGEILRLLCRRVRKQSMHKVNGLVFQP